MANKGTWQKASSDSWLSCGNGDYGALRATDPKNLLLMPLFPVRGRGVSCVWHFSNVSLKQIREEKELDLRVCTSERQGGAEEKERELSTYLVIRMFK